ncbi:MAG: hypothetical protein O7G86_20010, partial [Gammaproteobacteria bacterium]|nr:hypothetical protein [Gammaproteobacteria bacterium]
TPDSGIVDNFFTIKGKIAGFTTLLVGHYYDAESGSFDYGNEYDLQITRKLDRYTVGLKYATYSADGDVLNVGGPSVDTDKLWAWVQFAFN